MGSRIYILNAALLLFLSAGFGQAALPDVLERCCNVGRLWFTTNRERCSVYPSTVPGVAPADRAACSAVVDLCCMSQRQDRQCTLGKQSARLRRGCGALRSRPGSEHARECCHCCNVGIIAHEARLPCSLMVRFGPHCDAAFRECCENGRRPPPATSLSSLDNVDQQTSPQRGPPTATTQSSLLAGNDVGICARFPGQLCAHVCVNTPDSYRCACREGFTLQSDGRTCQQNRMRNRCDTNNPCHHECVDTGVAVHCRCFDGFRLEPDERSCRDIDECRQSRRPCPEHQRCVNTEGSYTCEGPSGPATIRTDRCPVGYSENPDTGQCEDIDECVIRLEPCSGGQRCVNTPGSFRCRPQRPSSDDDEDNVDDREDGGRQSDVAVDDDDRPPDVGLPLAGRTWSTPATTTRRTTTTRRHRHSRRRCGTGFHYNRQIDQCEDINECALNQDTCVEGQTCENTIGSFSCRRSMSCGTGYTLDQASQKCLDNDECRLGTHNCGLARDCHNIEGSFRCVPRTCPRGYRLNFRTGDCDPVICPRGRQPDDVGNCADINECEETPSVCRANQECRNTVGSYTCHNLITCSAGYELSDDGSRCEDVDECQQGTHECTGALMHCVNRPGTYICQCSEGFQMNHALRVCEDLDECAFNGQVCAQTARCENTYGSYRCVCKEGFELDDGQNCQDVDECQRPGMCQHTCRNTWGSFQCMCDEGYQLAADGRSCDDIDECREAADRGHHVCLGRCENTHGSFTCSCPPGYQMSSDHRTCHDVDECYLRTANCNGDDDVCINTRGGYKCQTVTCPRGFIKSPVVGNRSKSVHASLNNIKCQRKTFLCPQGDAECLYAPLSYSTNFITFPSRIRIPADLFTMRGPLSPYRRLAFDLKLIKAEDPRTGQRRISRSHFAVRQVRDNEAVIRLLLPVEGPQDVELQLDMNIFSREFRQNDEEVFFGTAVAKIYVYVTADDW